MAYIGPEPAESFTSFATQEFSTSATTSYTLDHAVANENEIALFVNNVRQQPGSGKAYTATGTALTLSAATASTDTMYCVFLGRALQTVTPATNSITAAMVGNDLISGKDALTSAPADTDEFLVSDAGTLKRIDYSLIKGGGITMAQQWRLTADFTGNQEPITSNLEIVDTFGYGTLGSNMTESSGVFTFPSTGYYLIMAHHFISNTNFERGATMNLNVTTDGSNFDNAGQSIASVTPSSSANTSNSSLFKYILDVTNTSTHKVSFSVNVVTTGSTSTKGNTSFSETTFTFIRLGDT